MIALPKNPKILVVALRRIGDVLLTTPLIRSLRRAWPDARIDVLVFADTAGILAGNPDINQIIATRAGAGLIDSAALGTWLFKRYALAISTQSGDRPTLFAAMAGRISVAPVAGGGLSSAVKKKIISLHVPSLAGLHRVEDMMRIVDALGIARVPQVVSAAGSATEGVVSGGPYAVLHPAPMFRYKRWTAEGWRALAGGLSQRGLRVLVSGGPAPEERAYLDKILADIPDVERIDGKFAWPELTALLARARVFVGPDTSVTHLAAASGAPTVAVYGPTDPRLWGPWPADGLKEPWNPVGTIQQRGNVWLVQNPQPCMPCQNEGCDHHIMSRSRCLDELTPRQVFMAVDQALETARPRVANGPEGR